MFMATVLVIDNEPLVCTLLHIVLTRHGYQVHTASSGREGIESFRLNRPNFTFLDLYLPDMTGIEVLKQIRRIDRTRTVMILTAAPSDTMERQALELGVTEFLLKGLPVDSLVGVVRQATAEPVAPSGSAPAMACSILLVDDDPTIRLWLLEALTQRGHRVRAAQDGLAALALVAAERPHLIVLDMCMPVMNGVEVLRRLREQKYEGVTMMLTGSHDEQLLKEALNLGAVDIVSKTADPERMILAIEARLIFTRR